MILYKKLGRKYIPIPTAEVIALSLTRLNCFPRLTDSVQAIQTSFMFGECKIHPLEGTLESSGVDPESGDPT